MGSGWEAVSIQSPLYRTKLSTLGGRCPRWGGAWDQFPWTVEATLLLAELHTAMTL